MMVVNKVLIIALVVLFQNGPAQKTILFFGDSITAGYGLSMEDAYPAHVQTYLGKKGLDVKVVNAGLSGETSAGGLSRIDWILRQPIDVFVLELGANDGLRGLPLDQTRSNLQAIIDKVKAKNNDVKIVLAGMMVPPNLGKEYTNEFKNIYPDLAKKNKATLIPFLLAGVAGDDKLNIADGIHPNIEGHKIVAKTVVEIIEPLLN
jgi:acyl-CoA thioesterase-1